MGRHRVDPFPSATSSWILNIALHAPPPTCIQAQSAVVEYYQRLSPRAATAFWLIG